MASNLPVCQRCSETLRPRGDRPPRFCPRCGQPVDSTRGDTPATTPDDAETCGLALGALLVALFGLFLYQYPIFGLLPIMMGITALGRIANSRDPMTGRKLAFAAIWLGLAECVIFAAIRVI